MPRGKPKNVGNPSKRAQARAWFYDRIPMTAEEAAGLKDRAKRGAFWAAHLNELRMTEALMRSLKRAIERGEDFTAWKYRARRLIKKAWGKEPSHLETVFRNATQSAYNAARYRELRKPEVMAIRPFWIYDAVLDTRTTKRCRKLNGTVLPAGDRFWTNHIPPLHHNCRSAIRGISRRTAMRRGVTKRRPRVPREGGFGDAPDGTVTQFDIGSVDLDVARIHKAKTRSQGSES